ncbi:MAG: fatty acyl-AMP ligase [Cyanobacteria bacterium P01_H01_bin.15]
MLVNSLSTSAEQRTLVEVLSVRASQQSHQTALIFLQNGRDETEHTTYQELFQSACAIANQLLKKIKPGDRAILLYPAGLDFVKAFIGCLFAGVIAVPVNLPNPRRPLTRLNAITKQASASVILTTAVTQEKLKKLPDSPLKQLASINTDEVLGAETTFAPKFPDPAALAFLQFTSGSTAQPKGVMVSHGNLMHNFAAIKAAGELSDSGVSVSWLPHFHDMGLINGILEPLYAGYLGVLMPPGAFLTRPLRWLSAIAKYGGTHSGAPNFAYEYCVKRWQSSPITELDLSSWESAYCGSEPIRVETLQSFTETFAPQGFRREAFSPVYGLAEATLMVSGGPLRSLPRTVELDQAAFQQNRVVIADEQSNLTKTVVCCGPPCIGFQIKIVDPDTHQELAEDRIGEVWLNSPSVAQGYWQQLELSTATFKKTLDDETGWLRTGDLGFIYNNEVYITGRLKDLIIINGANHYPLDIEATVSVCHPGIELSAAFAITNQGSEKLAIAVEIKRSALKLLNEAVFVEKLVGDICQAVRSQHELPLYDLALVKPATLPKTSSGKLQRQVASQRFQAGSLDALIDVSQFPTLARNHA